MFFSYGLTVNVERWGQQWHQSTVYQLLYRPISPTQPVGPEYLLRYFNHSLSSQTIQDQRQQPPTMVIQWADCLLISEHLTIFPSKRFAIYWKMCAKHCTEITWKQRSIMHLASDFGKGWWVDGNRMSMDNSKVGFRYGYPMSCLSIDSICVSTTVQPKTASKFRGMFRLKVNNGNGTI